jgi:hypothetical protein
MRSKTARFQPLPKGAIAFRPEHLDFERGIRVGNLEDNERITRLLKIGLEHRFCQPFVTERWGRGVYWQWIGYLPRANREAKPFSSHVSFGCAKYFVSMDTEEKIFQCGMQVERGYLKAPKEYPACQLRSDWDWHRLLGALEQDGAIVDEVARLVSEEGFVVRAGSWEMESAYLGRQKTVDFVRLRDALVSAPGRHWAGFQIYYPMRRREVHASAGVELIEAMLAIFDEVTPAMNSCMQVRLSRRDRDGPGVLL